MFKRFVTASALVAIASVAFAQNLSDKSYQFDVKTNAPGTGLPDPVAPNAEGDFVVDISGIQTWDEEGSPNNTIIKIDLLAGNPLSDGTVTGIGWDVNQVAGIDSGGASWLSEMVMGFDWDQDGVNDVFVTPSGTGSPGVESNSSGGILKLVDAGIPDGVSPGNSINVEFFESFVDEPGAPEGFFDDGSTITIQTGKVPEPSSLALLGLAGLSLLGLRRR